MSNITRGVASINFGAVGSDGGPGTTLAPLGLSKKDTVKLNQADATTTNILVEESDQPIDSIVTPGSISLSLTLANPDTTTMQKLFGGTVAGTSPNKTWNYPATQVSIYNTVQVVTKKGMVITIVNGLVVAKINGNLSNTDVLGVDITVTAQTPTKSGVGAIQYSE